VAGMGSAAPEQFGFAGRVNIGGTIAAIDHPMNAEMRSVETDRIPPPVAWPVVGGRRIPTVLSKYSHLCARNANRSYVGNR
jgi:hypothetical protein